MLGDSVLRPPVSWAESGILVGYDSVIIQAECMFIWKENFLTFLSPDAATVALQMYQGEEERGFLKKKPRLHFPVSL